MDIKKYNRRNSGYSMLELMVVISVIVMLIGILVPAIKGVKRIAKNLEQKSMFHALDIGLGLFKTDFGDYPESKQENDPDLSSTLQYTGAQHLAEAMVGRDDRGYEPSQNRKWNWPSEPAGGDLYFPDPADDAKYTKSSNRRKDPYINLKETGAFIMTELYDIPFAGDVVSEVEALGNGTSVPYRAPVLTDVFMTKTVDLDNGERIKVGSPILYYKANSSSKLFKKEPEVGDGAAEFATWIYNYEDNRAIIDAGPIDSDDPADKHHYDESYIDISTSKDGVDIFYGNISDENTSFDKPQNAMTYLLISAGSDGIFGTRDDVTNMKD